jgi:HEAT repeat protein
MKRIHRLTVAPTQQTSHYTGIVAGIIAFIAVVGVGVGAQSLLPSPIGDRSNAYNQTASETQLTIKQLKHREKPLDVGKLYHSEILLDVEKLDHNEALLNDELKQSNGGSLLFRSRELIEQTLNQQANATESMQALNSPKSAERAAAACLLGRLGAVEAIPALLNLLGDDTPIEPIKCWSSGNWSPALDTFKQASPGEQAAIALASFGQSAVDPLITMLNNASPSVRRNASWAIGEIRGGLGTDRSAAVEPLIALLGDADSWVRTSTAFSLGEMRPRNAIEALIGALGDVNWNVREMVARALGEMKTRAGVESLTALLLRDENGRVRNKAAWALGEIQDARAREALTLASSNDQDRRVRATARWAISELNQQNPQPQPQPQPDQPLR